MRVVKMAFAGIVLLALCLAGAIFIASNRTEAAIEAFQAQILQLGESASSPTFDETRLTQLPAPVGRYLRFVFRGTVPAQSAIKLTAEGQFRIPGTQDFNATTAEQVIAIGTPALMFSATTPVAPGIWARAYDFFAEGRMEMKAKILSMITVVDERETPELNRISLRRWLLEAPLFPQALLPGGPVTWQAIDGTRARATVSADGLTASMIAHFDETGRLLRMVAEEDGDLNTPYHGSGEHVTRSNYRMVNNMMIPHKFTISRAAKGKLYPFFDARITSIQFMGE